LIFFKHADKAFEETPDDYLDGWANKLKLVAELYSKGLLTEEEFNLAKEKLLRK